MQSRSFVYISIIWLLFVIIYAQGQEKVHSRMRAILANPRYQTELFDREGKIDSAPASAMKPAAEEEADCDEGG